MTNPLENRKGTAADQTVALLNVQADALRAELARLRHDLVAVQREFSELRGAQLVEANEQLVMATLLASSLADSAASNLDELSFSGQRDVLTDTPNYALMLDRLSHSLAMAKRRNLRLAVLFIDIDKFKQIHDTLGHAAGDAVLRLVATRLTEIVRDSDTVCRHGANEFLVMLGEVRQPSDAALIATKILAPFEGAAHIGDHDLRLSLSLGIAVYPEDGDKADTLIGRAGAAMYQAKKRGGGYAFHSERGQDLPAPMCAEPSRGPAEPGMRDLREANQQLLLAALAAQELEGAAQESHRQQVRFLAMVAHELRNPLTPIGTAAELLGRAGTNEQQLAQLQVIIKRQVGHMTRLISDLLDGSRVSEGKFQLRRSNVDMVDVFNLAAETCRTAMDSRAQSFTMHLPPGPLIVYGDAVRLAQVFSNLLDNATKYTPKNGAITLTVVCQGPEMVITVSDTGIGITAEALPEVFNLFVQEKRTAGTYDDARGLGIGLAVVRDLVEGHGGKVVGTSDGAGKGSSFVVTLPVRSLPAAS